MIEEGDEVLLCPEEHLSVIVEEFGEEERVVEVQSVVRVGPAPIVRVSVDGSYFFVPLSCVETM